jgi:hypothetical protein
MMHPSFIKSADKPFLPRSLTRTEATTRSLHRASASAPTAGQCEGERSRSHHPARNTQFQHISAQKYAFAAAGCPIVSADTKRKALIGNFKNAGHVWCQQPIKVSVLDFPGEALGRAVRYGIYDLEHN